MFRNFYPWEYSKSVFDIDYKKLYRQGYRGIIFDVDNTLVHHGDDSTPEVDQLFRTLHEIGFKTFLLTDNNEERVKDLYEILIHSISVKPESRIPHATGKLWKR